jgi:hypothetical protein
VPIVEAFSYQLLFFLLISSSASKVRFYNEVQQFLGILNQLRAHLPF